MGSEQEEALALFRRQTELNERSQTMLALLYEVAERTGHQHEAFYSLRLINDLVFTARAALGKVEQDPLAAMRAMVQLGENVNAAIAFEIDRLDA